MCGPFGIFTFYFYLSSFAEIKCIQEQGAGLFIWLA